MVIFKNHLLTQVFMGEMMSRICFITLQQKKKIMEIDEIRLAKY